MKDQRNLLSLKRGQDVGGVKYSVPDTPKSKVDLIKEKKEKDQSTRRYGVLALILELVT